MAFYFVIANPMTGRVERRANVGRLATEGHLMEFRVSKTQWRAQVVGEAVKPEHLSPANQARWRASRAALEKFVALANSMLLPHR